MPLVFQPSLLPSRIRFRNDNFDTWPKASTSWDDWRIALNFHNLLSCVLVSFEILFVYFLLAYLVRFSGCERYRFNSKLGVFLC